MTGWATFARRALVLAVLALVPGCIQVPELDSVVPEWTEDAAYPALIPLGPEHAATSAPAEDTRRIETTLNARRARLQARARRLTGPVLDDTARDRMRRGVQF